MNNQQSVKESGKKEIGLKEIKETRGYIKVGAEIKNVIIDIEGGRETIGGIYFEGETPISVKIKAGEYRATIGQTLINKPKGELEIEIEGEVVLQGSDATFGPSSFGACPCIVGDEVRVYIPHGSKLTMQGGRSLESALKGAYDRASAIQVKTFTVTQE